MTARPGCWVVRPRPNPDARVRLFCLPSAGGGPAVFHRWPVGLPSDVEVCAVQLPGRGARLNEAPFDRTAPLVETLAVHLVPYLDRPFAFFGHSMGALVSFELARLLRRMGAGTPRHVFVAAFRAPQLHDPRRALHDLPEPELIAQLRRLNGIPAQLIDEVELMQLVLPAVRADLAACETYEYSRETPLSCPITAFGGRTDPKAERDELEPWREQTSGHFELHILPGDHFFVHSAGEQLLPIIAKGLA